MTNKKITVFCSASNVIEESYLDFAHEVGRMIARNGNDLVTGCSINGCMGDVARGFDEEKKKDQKHIGVFPTQLNGKEEPYEADQVIIKESLISRQQLLIELADEFYILPGGFGTMYELFQVLTEMSVGILPLKEMVIFNQDGFYDCLDLQLLEMKRKHVISCEVYRHIHIKSVTLKEEEKDE